MHDNTLLVKAVDYLYSKRIITKDRDICNKMGYSSGTVSSYLSGKAKASLQFEKEFEKTFNIRLNDFVPGGAEDAIKIPDSIQMISESVLQMKAELQTNRQLMVEILALVSHRSVMEIQVMSEKLLEHNLAKILNELKQE